MCIRSAARPGSPARSVVKQYLCPSEVDAPKEGKYSGINANSPWDDFVPCDGSVRTLSTSANTATSAAMSSIANDDADNGL